MPRVTDEHRAARRQEILTAAVRCVVREGFHKTTMADVIAESGLSAGAVYGYFKGKTDLIMAIAEQAVGDAVTELQESAEAPGTVTIVGAFEALVDGVTMRHDLQGMGSVAVHAWSEAARDDRVREVVARRIDQLHAAWMVILDRTAADGTFDAGDDQGAVARILVGLMPGFIVQGLLLDKVDSATYVRGLEALLGGS